MSTVVAELEVRHSRVIAPTRRVALGELYLPLDHGPLLLAAIVGACCANLEDDQREELERLLDDVSWGRRIAQPRLRYRFQTDVHGLDRSRHRLVQDGESLRLELDDHGGLLPQALAALYAAARLSCRVRPEAFRLMRRATRWEGLADQRLLRYLTSDEAPFRRAAALGDEGWALEVLGFGGGIEPVRSEILRRFRALVREAHPDHGAEADDAGRRITELTEAKRILLAGA